MLLVTQDKVSLADSLEKSPFVTVVCVKNSGNIAWAVLLISLTQDSVLVKEVAEYKLLQLEVELDE